VAILAGCCHDWIQSVEKVLTDIQNSKTECSDTGSESGVGNTVLAEINGWERKMKRFETMEAQLNMPAVQVW
jgi:hypothetical protein